jgi:hypothetical protein
MLCYVMFRFPCINQVHNIQVANQMHFNVYNLVESHFSH